MKYKHLFFDLDRTLWDFDSNFIETFKEIFTKFSLEQNGIPSLEAFTTTYIGHNDRLWDLYRNDKISKEELRDTRFIITLNDFGINNVALANEISEEYIFISPRKGILMPGTIEVLEQLKNEYHLHIITNGFEEIQKVKMEYAGLNDYFDCIVTSEEAGSKKPDNRIFNYALEKAGAKVTESIMIGDDFEVDILGATSIGMDTIFYDPKNTERVDQMSTYRVTHLTELLSLLERKN
ncbi:MAG: noncanonical pyrimidine nucleotidase, YjjG family [Bacteroidetes bacterium]|nr:noncanonical pyrimidine nucleotidase, YjjG family [Bacteroidota bacterium]